MKVYPIVFLLLTLMVMQSLGRDLSQYLVVGEKYLIVPEKREEIVRLTKSGSDFDKRAVNALLAFETFEKAQENSNYDFTETMQHIQTAISDTTNDWVNIWAKFTLLGVHNLQPNSTDRHQKITEAKSLLKAIVPATWEAVDNPILKLGRDSEQLTVEKMRQLVSGSIVNDYCSLYRFEDAETFLKTCPDSSWKRESEKNLALQRDGHARSIEEAKQNRLREKALKEKLR